MRAIELGQELDQLSISELQSFSPLLTEDVRIALSLEQTLKSKSQAGGTAPAQVKLRHKEAQKSQKEKES